MKEKKTHELVGSLIGNLVGLALVNSVLLWRSLTQGVVLATWVDILWAANLSLIVQVAGRAILAFYRPARFYSFMEMAIAGLGLLGVIVFYIVFPLDFGAIHMAGINTAVKIALWVGMAGGAIGTIVWLVRFVAGHQYAGAEAR